MNYFTSQWESYDERTRSSFTELRKTKIAIKSLELFKHFEPHIGDDYSFSIIIDSLKELAIRSANINFDKSPADGSINNSRGRWFELLFLSKFKSLLSQSSEANNIDIYKLPSASENKPFYKLFIPAQRAELKIMNPSTSNPDFMIAKKTVSQSAFTPSPSIVNKYQDSSFFGNVNMDDVISFISIKTSARPDRRYQQIYEANLVKALFHRFEKQIDFISINMEHTKRNKEIYNSSSIISILEDIDDFSPAIDQTFVMKESSDVMEVINYIVSNGPYIS